MLARDRGVGADVSVQPGFVIIIPYRRKHRVLRFVVLPWTLRMKIATKQTAGNSVVAVPVAGV